MPEQRCRWCGEVREHSPIHPACAREMKEEGISFRPDGIKLAKERAIIILKENDIPKKQYERIRDRDKDKLSRIRVLNRWIEPIEKLAEESEKAAVEALKTSSNIINPNLNDS